MKFREFLQQNENKQEYEKYFRKMLDKYGVSSPDELDDEEKKKFFDEVDSGWQEK